MFAFKIGIFSFAKKLTYHYYYKYKSKNYGGDGTLTINYCLVVYEHRSVI